jgi:hypothetical protein
MHSSVQTSTSASCLLLPVVVLGVPAHHGHVHGVPGCHGCLPACCRWFLEFQIFTVAWFMGFKAVTVTLFMGSQLVTDVFLLAVARFCTSFEPMLSSCLIPSSLSLVALALVQMTVNSAPF